jgi:CHASE2 domain-containing sensor protein
MSAADAAAVERMLDGGIGGVDYIGMVIWVASGLTWFAMALAAAVAVKQVGGRGPMTLMVLGAAVFAVGHPFPPGPIGIALFGLGVAWLELRRSHALVPEAQPVLVP